MMKLVSRAFFFCVITAIALISISDATPTISRNEDISSSMAVNGTCNIFTNSEDLRRSAVIIISPRVYKMFDSDKRLMDFEQTFSVLVKLLDCLYQPGLIILESR